MSTRGARRRNVGASDESAEKVKAEDDTMGIQEGNSAGEKSAIEKVPIKLVIDKSKEPIGVTNYLAMALWLGWPFFYLLLLWTFPLLYLYARPLLAAILGMLVLSALYPIDSRKQPKWAMDLGAAVMK